MMGIIPFYGEVAVVPAMGTVNGVFVVDGVKILENGVWNDEWILKN